MTGCEDHEHAPGECCCEEVNRFLADLVDGSLSEELEARFNEHLTRCPACVAFLDQYRLTIQLVREDREIEVPERLVEHTLEFLRNRMDPA